MKQQQQQQQRAVIWQCLFHYVFTAGKCWNKSIESVAEWRSTFSPSGEAVISLSKMKMHALLHRQEMFVFTFGMHAYSAHVVKGCVTAVPFRGPPLPRVERKRMEYACQASVSLK